MIFFFFWLCHMVCGISVPQPGIEPAHPAVEVWRLNHWTAREVSSVLFDAIVNGIVFLFSLSDRSLLVYRNATEFYVLILYPGTSLSSFLFFYFFFWLCWVFVSELGLSLVAASGGHPSSRCVGLSLSRPLLLRSTGSRRAGSVLVAHGPSCSAACGIFPDQGSNPCPLH